MTGENLNPETTAATWQQAQPEAAPSFGGPLPQRSGEGGSEKKNRKRNKKKNKDRSAQPPQLISGEPAAPRSELPKPELRSLAEHFDETVKIWDRSNEDLKNKEGGAGKASQLIGEKALAIEGAEPPVPRTAEIPAVARPATENITAEQQEHHQTPKLPEAKPEEMVRHPDVKPAEPDVKEDVIAAEPEKTADKTERPPATLEHGSEPIRYNVQEQVQHMAQDMPPSPNEHESAPEPPKIEREQSFDIPVPPPMPPDPVSYRRQFWNEQTPGSYDEQAAKHEVMPSIYEYDQAAGAQYHAEQPIGTVAAGMGMAGDAVRLAAGTGQAMYESTIPPGLQRSAGEMQRKTGLALIVGYAAGRIHGRRKAEARGRKEQARIQEQAGKQVKAAELQTMTAERRAANRHAEAQLPPPATATLGERPIPQNQMQEVSHSAAELPIRIRPEYVSPGARTAEVMAAPAAVAAAVVAFERSRPHPPAEQRPVPRAARVAAAKAAETVLVRAPEAPAPVIALRSERQLGKRELLKVAKDIKIDGVPLKDVYKAKRIDEEGLRVVVDTYLKGGDVRQELTKEIVTKERSYEIDPALRHQRSQEEHERRSGAGSGRSEKVGQALGHVKDVAVGQGGKVGGVVAAVTATTAKRTTKAVAKSAKIAQRDLIDNANTSDWLGITLIVVIYSVILFLIFGR